MHDLGVWPDGNLGQGYWSVLGRIDQHSAHGDAAYGYRLWKSGSAVCDVSSDSFADKCLCRVKSFPKLPTNVGRLQGLPDLDASYFHGHNPLVFQHLSSHLGYTYRINIHHLVSPWIQLLRHSDVIPVCSSYYEG